MNYAVRLLRAANLASRARYTESIISYPTLNGRLEKTAAHIVVLLLCPQLIDLLGLLLPKVCLNPRVLPKRLQTVRFGLQVCDSNIVFGPCCEILLVEF